MTAVDDTPQNRNFLSPLNYQFQIKRSPNLNFFLQKVNIPSITLPEYQAPNPFVTIPTSHTNVDFGQLDITFKVDEDLQNYMELYYWIIKLGFPSEFAQYKSIAQNPVYTGTGIESDISLVVLDSAKNPNYEIVFHNAIPISLGEIIFDSTYGDVDYVTASASFKYILFEVNKITN